MRQFISIFIFFVALSFVFAKSVQAQVSTPNIVDHTNLHLFEQIPSQYMTAASNLKMIFLDRSVGMNISDGLDCWAYPSYAQAPSRCKRTTHSYDAYNTGDWTDSTINFQPSSSYNRDNWDYVFFGEFPASTSCSYWYEKMDCFMEIDTNLPPSITREQNGNLITVQLFPFSQYDVISYQNSYLEVGEVDTIAQGYFGSTNRNDVYDLENWASQLPGKTLIHWTSSLARGVGSNVSDSFNLQMRSYARNNNKYLIDAADILSHDPEGQPCYDNRDGVPYSNSNSILENYPNDGVNRLAVCQDYTVEFDGGHLGNPSGGNLRVAKAVWIVMAQIAGWRPGGGSAGTPTQRPTNTASPRPTSVVISGDANGDGRVDGVDYIIWLNHYNTSTNNGQRDGDFNVNRFVDGVDYVVWLNSYRN